MEQQLTEIRLKIVRVSGRKGGRRESQGRKPRKEGIGTWGQRTGGRGEEGREEFISVIDSKINSRVDDEAQLVMCLC